MANDHITTSQSLLKELQEDMNALYKLFEQGKILTHNLGQTWTALSVTHGNFQKEVGKEKQG